MVANPVERFSLAELQSAFGRSALEAIDQLMEFLAEGAEGGGSRLPISADKQRLSRVYIMSKLDHLPRPAFRQRLLKGLDNDELRALVPTLVDEPDLGRPAMVRQIANSPWKRGSPVEALVEALGLPLDVLPSEEIQSIRPGISAINGAVTPFRWPLDYQHAAHDDILRAFRSPGARVLLQLPTGAGKTFTATNVVATFINERVRNNQSANVVWLTHATELCIQAIESFRAVWQHRGERSIEEGRAWDGRGFPKSPRSPSILFSTLQTARGACEDSASWKADLIVLDEAHVALASTYRATLESLEGHNCRTLGLTATPGRGGAGRMANEALAEMFSGRIVGLHASESENPIARLQNRQILARMQWKPLLTNLEVELDVNELQRIGRGEDFSQSALMRLGRDLFRNKLIIEQLEKLCQEGRRILYFAPSVEQSRVTATVLGLRGHAAFHIDGKTPGAARSFAINQFRAGRIQVLSNYGVLAVGFDAPATDCLVIARPTSSIVQYSQMIGRGLRGPRLGGSSTCQIVQVVDLFTQLPNDLGELYAAFSEYWSNHAGRI